ncbi:uncharacterized protein LOC112199419 [Rosa chinensis]|uniref:uncharacterized protein LOC112199419 n=1 Tax=Rosa chinensis TaxID=74649 RepID=UPI001AD8FCA0|nr:uncharacterized protein LOC112199419 [Rosa chinensis]
MLSSGSAPQRYSAPSPPPLAEQRIVPLPEKVKKSRRAFLPHGGNEWPHHHLRTAAITRNPSTTPFHRQFMDFHRHPQTSSQSSTNHLHGGAVFDYEARICREDMEGIIGQAG